MAIGDSLTPSAVVDLLRTGRSAELIGQRESPQLEFKLEPYRLADDRQKYELAKDVSALANAAGGVIVVGIRTQRDETHPWDRAVEIRPFPSDLVNAQQYGDVLQAWIYPPLEGVEIQSHPDPNRADHSLASILAPAQRPSVSPFLVAKAVSEEGRVVGSLVGYFERRGPDARPLSVHEIHGMLRDARLFRRVLDERVGVVTGEPVVPPPLDQPQAKPAARLPDPTRQRAAELTEVAKLAERAAYTLTATPVPYVDASEMFQAEDNPITLILRSPPKLRDMGFDLNTGQQPAIHRGQLRRAVLDGYKGLDCWRDGTLVFVATADDDFLSWGERQAEDPLRINPVPLLESSLLFCKLASALYHLVSKPPTYVIYTLHLRRMCIGSKPPILRRGLSDSRYAGQVRAAPSCEADVAVVAGLSDSPSKAAYQLIRDVYAWFGHTYNSIPYVQGEAIDEAAIASL
jgi:schlafen family protein